MNVEPQEEHRWLQQFVGDWTYVHEAPAAPGETPMRFTGRERVRPLGDFWTIGEAEGDMPGGGTARMIFTLGYDPAKARFTGTFVASMMTHLWIYEGELDAERRKLTLSAEGPSMTGEGTAHYHDIFEIVDRETRLLRSEMQGADGAWTEIMRAEYKRDWGVPSV